LQFTETSNETINGKVSVQVEKVHSEMKIELLVPEATEALVYLKDRYSNVTINGTTVFKGTYVSNPLSTWEGTVDGHHVFRIRSGQYSLVTRQPHH